MKQQHAGRRLCAASFASSRSPFTRRSPSCSRTSCCTTTSCSSAGPRPPPPQREEITYVTVSPPGGRAGRDDRDDAGEGDGADATTRCAVARAERVVPPRRRPAAGGTPGGVVGGTGVGGGSRRRRPASCPAEPDPRLATDGQVLLSRVQDAGAARRQRGEGDDHRVQRFRRAGGGERAGAQPGDWTFERNGKKWGVDGSKIYLGKFWIPSAVLAALPIRVAGQSGRDDRRPPRRRRAAAT